jgi:alkylation response protein AidB-like acyl-CoA dehydrogenase
MPDIYGLDATAAPFVAAAAEISRNILDKHAVEVDEKAKFPGEAVASLGAQGLLGLCVSKDLGGKGAGPRAFVGVVEELAQHDSSTAMIYVMHVAGQQAIAAGRAKSRDAILKEIAAGKHLTTLALSEKGSRSNFWLPSSKLEANGDGFKTTAAKSWVTSASHAQSYVSASQRPGAGSPLESTCYLVRPGNSARVAAGFNGLGLRGNDSSPVSIEAHEVKSDDLLTEQGKGIEMILQVVLPWFAIGTSAMSNGICRAAVGATSAHLANAGMDGGSKLRDLPQLRARISEMSVRTEASRALLGFTLDLIEQPSELTPLYVLQEHLPLERLFRDARAGWVMAPTVDHLKDFIGKALTGLPLL